MLPLAIMMADEVSTSAKHVIGKADTRQKPAPVYEYDDEDNDDGGHQRQLACRREVSVVYEFDQEYEDDDGEEESAVSSSTPVLLLMDCSLADLICSSISIFYEHGEVGKRWSLGLPHLRLPQQLHAHM